MKRTSNARRLENKTGEETPDLLGTLKNGAVKTVAETLVRVMMMGMATANGVAVMDTMMRLSISKNTVKNHTCQ